MAQVRPPFVLRQLFSNLVWCIPQNRKVLYLTFDDGPIPEITPFVLEQLEKYNAKATFFCVGNNVQKNKELYQLILDKGHRTGNHTFNHVNGFNTTVNLYLKDTIQAAEHINSDLFRPPHGRLRFRAMQVLRLKYKIVMWDVLSGDYNLKYTAEKVISNVIKKARPGSIIVFHDSLKAEPRLRIALPSILEHFSKLEYSFEIIPNY